MTGRQDEPSRGTPRSDLGRAVLCVAGDAAAVQLGRVLADAGFAVVAEVERGLEILPAVADLAPDVVVMDITVAGTLGTRLLTMTRMLAPDTVVVALAPRPFADLPEALAAGARAVVSTDDLRTLRQVLDDVAGSPSGWDGERQHEAAAVVAHVPAVLPGDAPGDGQAQA